MSRTSEELMKQYGTLKDKSAEEILLWAHKTLGKKLGMTTGLGYSGMILMHYIYKMGLDIDLYFIDTGYHFPETIELVQRIKDEWGLKINIINADDSLRRYVRKTLGKEPWKANPNLCCHYCKVAPLISVLPKKHAWLSAIRRDQTHTRSKIENIEIDGRGTVKIYPLARWTKRDAWKYIKENDLPYNPLHDKGYMSIGCKPCTAPVGKGDDERDGRWKSTPKFDCGMHVHKTG